MSQSNQSTTLIANSAAMPGDLCEVCIGKDDEDLYIVFNILYRVIVGDAFQQGSDQAVDEFDLDSLSYNQNQDDYKTSQGKLQSFRNKVSSQALIELISSPRFDLLLREIFKSKYSRIQETNCKHHELAMNFIRNFNLKNDDNYENSDTKRRSSENIEKLDILYNKVKQIKSEIESYHSQIDSLSDRIIKKLLPNQSSIAFKKSNDNDLYKDDSSDKSSEIYDPDAEKKYASSNDSANFSSSTALNSESTNNVSNDPSDPVTGESKHKKPKTATFKSKLPKKATDILKNWFLTNITNPYPSHEAKEMLSKMTGLTRKQIQNWFTNSRKRFLEPLKKKLEGQKMNKDGTYPAELTRGIFSPDSHSPEHMADENPSPVQSVPGIQGVQQVPPIIPTQIKPRPEIVINQSIPNVAENINLKNGGFQKPQVQINPQIQPQAIIQPQAQFQPQLQSLLYQGALPAGATFNSAALPPGSNYVIVPCVVAPQTQPIYSYRPMYQNVMPIGTPQFLPLQQTTAGFAGGLPIIDNSAILNNPGAFQIQPNSIDLNGILKQQQQQQQQVQQQLQLQQFPQVTPQTHQPISNSFNTVNNNVYNSLSQQSLPGQPVFNSQDMMPYLNKMPQFGQQPNINIDKVMYNITPENLQKQNSGVYHPRPEMFDLNNQGQKQLHKNPFTETNLS